MRKVLSSFGGLFGTAKRFRATRRRARSAGTRAPAPLRLEELEPRLVLSVPQPDHVVIVIEENHSYSSIIGSSEAPYINALAEQGALFTSSFALTHPSQPNYLALFSGSTQGVFDDSCPHTFSEANLGGELEAAGFTFGGYSEDLPSVGYTGCSYGAYRRKHNPWVDFTDVPASDNMPFDGYFPSDFSTLPTVSIVVPNQDNDMHDGTIQQADDWLQGHLDDYVQWAQTNNSLLIVTWDEDDGTEANRIPTIFVGAMVVAGQYDEVIDHFNVLRTVEDMYGLPYAGLSAVADPIEDVWVDQGPGPSVAGPGVAPAVPYGAERWSFKTGTEALLPPWSPIGNDLQAAHTAGANGLADPLRALRRGAYVTTLNANPWDTDDEPFAEGDARQVDGTSVETPGHLFHGFHPSPWRSALAPGQLKEAELTGGYRRAPGWPGLT